MQLTAPCLAVAADAPPLELEKKIPLGNVSGRIDHFALDRPGQRLFLAELGNNSVGVIDLQSGKVVNRVTGLSEPQGVGYLAEAHALFVANGGDGSVRVYRGDFSPLTKIDLNDDADNVRVNEAKNEIVVGFGSGGLAIIDGKSLAKKAEVHLKDHPEGFQIDPARGRVYANIPDAHEIAVLDLATGREISTWDKLPGHANFPMALFDDGERVAVAFRSPPLLTVFDAASGAVISNMPTCGDADDVFFDPRRDRLYVSCGEGKIDVFESARTIPRHLDQIRTAIGARTAFFDPETDRYYLAVRAGLTRPAEVWVYRAH